MKHARTVVEERIVTTWECDMCGSGQDARIVTLVARPCAGINTWEFADLCAPCRTLVLGYIKRHRQPTDGE